ncbi:MAG: hypothetical protein R3236_12050, partial [Phycisphaeraceae bacterium]|nr:hypothetical protein [Phycisphaeraceae bacterium]
MGFWFVLIGAFSLVGAPVPSASARDEGPPQKPAPAPDPSDGTDASDDKPSIHKAPIDQMQITGT